MAINVPIVSEWEPTGLKKALKDFQKLETTGQKVSYGLEKAFLPATAAVAGLAAAAGLSLKAAVEDEAQQAELARQLQVTTGATEAQVAAVEDYISQTELAAAVSDNELRPAFGNLVRATGDVTEAQELMTLALDVAAGTGKDLEGVTEALQEAIQGEVGPLKELDKSLTDVIESGADTDTVMAQLAETFGGAAAASTETAAGRFELMQIQLQNAREAIGMALLPILEELIPVLESVANFVANNTDTLIVLGTAIGTVSAAIIVANGVMKAWGAITTITKALNLALATSFTALQVATGIIVFTALIAIFVALQRRFNILGKAVDGLSKLFGLVKAAAKKMVDFVVAGINKLIDVINKIPFVDIKKIGNTLDDAADAAEQLGEASGNAVNPISAMKDVINDARDAFDSASGAFESATDHMDEFMPSVEDVTAAIKRQQDATDRHIEEQKRLEEQVEANTEAMFGLSKEFDFLFNRFDNTEAVRNFSDSITTLTGEIKEFGENSREAEEAQEDVYRALGEVIEQLDNIPESKQLELLAMLDQGAYDEALRQVNILAHMADTALTTLTAAEVQAAAGMVGAGNFAPAAPVPAPVSAMSSNAASSPMNVVVNMPAGSNGEDVARALQKHARKNGTLQIPTTSLVR